MLRRARQKLEKAGSVMKNAIFLLSVVTVLLTGCTKEIISMMNQGTRQDVFQEITGNARIPDGYAKLTIVASLKTHKPGIYLFGSKTRGTRDYVLLINIDGQKVEVKGNLREETSEPKGLVDPEAGEGIRYIFKKDVLLKAGPHKLIVALPEERVVVKRELTFKEGTTNILRLVPIYRSTNPSGNPGRGSLSCSSFMAGVVGFWVYLNGFAI